MKTLFCLNIFLFWLIILTGNQKSELDLSLNDVQYIYNKALDILVNDKRASSTGRGILPRSNTLLGENPIISVDDALDEFDMKFRHIDELSNVNLNLFEESPQIFPTTNFCSLHQVRWQHFENAPDLQNDHVLHVQFTSIFYYGSRLFVGAKCTYQAEMTPDINTLSETFIFEIEQCTNKMLYFRYMYIPLGWVSIGLNYNKRTFSEIECN